MINESKIIAFGVEETFKVNFGTGNVNSVYPINSREYIVTTPKEMIKMEKTNIKVKLPYHFCASCLIPDVGMIAAISVHNSELFILNLNDLSHPLLKNYQTNHTGIFHIFYSVKSSCIITIGSGVKTWNLNCIMPDGNVTSALPSVTVTPRACFGEKFETLILNPPAFDYQRELLFLPTQQGIQGFTLDGKQMVIGSRVQATNVTVFSYCNTNRKLLTADQHEGICLWNKMGKLHHRYSIGTSSIFLLKYITSEHVILMNSKGNAYILNVKTGNAFHVYSAPEIPTRFFIFLQPYPTLVLCYHSTAAFLKITIPWGVWAKNVVKSRIIRRMPKKNHAARILVQTLNSFVKLFDPRNGKSLTSATPTGSSNLYNYYYDRGTYLLYKENQVEVYGTEHKDNLYLIMEDGKASVYDAAHSPCEETGIVDLKSHFIIPCTIDGKWYYFAAAMRSEVFLLDQTKFRYLKRAVIGIAKTINIFFLTESETAVIMYESETYLFDLKSFSVINKILIRGSDVSELHGDIIYIGQPTGQIDMIKIVGNELILLNNLNQQRIHASAVSGLGFSPNFWITVGLDGVLMYWDYNYLNLCRICLPEPLLSCEILNGKRDVIIGTENEIMKIHGDIIFGDQVDEELHIIDNFDRMFDSLSPVQHTIEEDDDMMLAEDDGFYYRRTNHRRAQNQGNDKGKANGSGAPRSKKIKDYIRKKFQIDPEALAVLNKLNNEEAIAKAKKEDEERRKRQLAEEMMRITQEGEEYHSLIAGKSTSIRENGESDDKEENQDGDGNAENDTDNKNENGEDGSGEKSKDEQKKKKKRSKKNDDNETGADDQNESDNADGSSRNQGRNRTGGGGGGGKSSSPSTPSASGTRYKTTLPGQGGQINLARYGYGKSDGGGSSSNTGGKSDSNEKSGGKSKGKKKGGNKKGKRGGNRKYIKYNGNFDDYDIYSGDEENDGGGGASGGGPHSVPRQILIDIVNNKELMKEQISEGNAFIYNETGEKIVLGTNELGEIGYFNEQGVFVVVDKQQIKFFNTSELLQDDSNDYGNGKGRKKLTKKQKQQMAIENLTKVKKTSPPVQRAPTPPSIRPVLGPPVWERLTKRAATPVSTTHQLKFKLPAPCIVLDQEKVLDEFARGKVHLLPIMKQIDNQTIAIPVDEQNQNSISNKQDSSFTNDNSPATQDQDQNKGGLPNGTRTKQRSPINQQRTKDTKDSIQASMGNNDKLNEMSEVEKLKPNSDIKDKNNHTTRIKHKSNDPALIEKDEDVLLFEKENGMHHHKNMDKYKNSNQTSSAVYKTNKLRSEMSKSNGVFSSISYPFSNVDNDDDTSIRHTTPSEDENSVFETESTAIAGKSMKNGSTIMNFESLFAPKEPPPRAAGIEPEFEFPGQDYYNEFKKSKHIPISARIIHHIINDNDAADSDEGKDMLETALLDKFPALIKSPPKIKPPRISMNRIIPKASNSMTVKKRGASVEPILYKSARRPKIYEPVGDMAKSITIRNTKSITSALPMLRNPE